MEIPVEEYPKRFPLPVDSEHKATEFRLFSAAPPYFSPPSLLSLLCVLAG